MDEHEAESVGPQDPRPPEVLSLTDDDGVEVCYRRWLPTTFPRALVLVLHGASEHSGRYSRFGSHLADAGYAAYADDHRGFGYTSSATGIGKCGPRGFDGVLHSIHAVHRRALADIGSVPVVVFGHSMGSVFAQVYAQRHASELAGFALCGSFGPSPDIEEMISGMRAAIDAGMGDQPLEMLGPFNAGFEGARTSFDWLSRDDDEVDAYIADPLAGEAVPLTFGYSLGVLELLREGGDPKHISMIGSGMPVLLITGDADPVSRGGETVRPLEQLYREAGLDVVAHYYSGARHELLNETNRDEVERDILEWLARIA